MPEEKIDFSFMDERIIEVTNEKAIEWIGKFLSEEWKYLKPQDIKLTRFQISFVNQVYLVSNEKTEKEPRKVILRKYGGNLVSDISHFRPLNRTQELVLMTELASRNLSPKIIGFFEEGRIEEFVDSHIMTREEAYDPELENDLAKNLARFHAVDNIPFPKPGYMFEDVLRDVLNVSRDNMETFLQDKRLEGLHKVMQVDWESEIN